MDLARLSKEDLGELMAALGHLERAMAAVAKAGLVPVLTLTPAATMIRAAGLLDDPAAAEVVIDPPGEASPDLPEMMPWVDASPQPDNPLPSAPPLVVAEEMAAPPAGPTGRAGGGKERPLPGLSDAVRAQIAAMVDQGLRAPAIAQQLGLRPSVVAGMVGALVRRRQRQAVAIAADLAAVARAEAAHSLSVPAAEPVPAPEPVAEADTFRSVGQIAAQMVRRGNNPPVWTEEEDARLCDLVVAQMRAGLSRNRAARAAASAMGRPEEGVAFRVASRLRDRIAAALQPQDLPASQHAAGEPAEPDALPFSPSSLAAGSAAGAVAATPAASKDDVAAAAAVEPRRPESSRAAGSAGGVAVPEPSPPAPRNANPAPVRPVAAQEGAGAPLGQCAPARPVASVAVPAPVVEAASTCPDDLHGESRRLWLHLDQLGYGRARGMAEDWDAELDHELVEQLAAGARVGELALDLGIGAEILAARFRALSAPIRDDRDRVTIDGQQRLLAVLKARLLRARRGAAA